jgi:transposase
LTPVWVPDAEQEAMRDLSRAREDMKIIDKQLRQRLNGFLLRQGRIWSGRGRWTQAHWRWLETQRFDSPYQQIVLEEYVEAVQAAQQRTAELDKQLQEASESWSLRTAMQAAMALRGVDRTAAITLLAELDDLSRFENPCQLMSYVGLVPSERSSGDRRRQGKLTKAGNAHARRILVECAWAYRFPARKTALIQRRAEKAPLAVQAIAWQAQKRLCGRFRRLQSRGLSTPKTVTAIARELCGFIWAVVCEAQRPGTFSAPA